MKKFALVLVLIICLTMPNFTASAAGNNLEFHSNSSIATFTMTRGELDGHYYNSRIKYYTFSVPGLSVRADKNNFYDFDVKYLTFTIAPSSFTAEFTYKNGTKRKIATANLEMRYTVTSKSVNGLSVADFSGNVVTHDSVESGKMVFFTKKLGSFSIKTFEFSDANNKNIWYYSYVNGSGAKGIMSGMGDGTFAPEQKVTRAQLAAMIVKATDHLISYRMYDDVSFDDVKKGSWYHDYVIKCASVGIFLGKGNGKFAPNDHATRQEIAALAARIIRIAGSFNGKAIPSISSTKELSKLYKDAKQVADYAKKDVILCNKLSVMIGDERGFRPKDNITRAECAKIFYRLKNSLK